jgi:phosphoglycerate kinase
MDKLSIEDVDFKGKRVIARVDYNVPIKNGIISDDTRIVTTLPTIKYILEKGAKSLVLMSHLGRPDGIVVPKYTLKPVAEHLEKVLGKPVAFISDCVGLEVETIVSNAEDGQVILLENLRFHVEEEGKGVDKDGNNFKATKENVAEFRASLSKLGDIYVCDAFGTAHRPHSSIVGVDLELKVCGYLMKKELDYFAKTLNNPERPFVCIMGGAKVRDKIQLIKNMLDKVDEMVIVGGMAYTFKKTIENVKIGKSLFDEEGAKIVQELVDLAKSKGVKLHFPTDYLCADKFDKDASTEIATDETGIKDDWQGLDIGPESIKQLSTVIENAKTICWNGPAGVFEFPNFSHGSRGMLEAVIKATKNGATSIIGGGDTASFVVNEGKENEISHVSTGGGASLELLEGKVLPGVSNLTDKK